MAPYSYLVLTFLTAGIIVYPHINFPDDRDNNTAILGNGSSPHIRIYGQYSRRIVSHNSGVITSLTKADSLYSRKTGSYSSSNTTISNLCYQVPAATTSNNYLETQIRGIKVHVICYRRYESDRLDRIFNRCRNFMIQMKEIVSNFDDDHASFSPAKFNWRITATFINITLPISTLRRTFVNLTLDFGNKSHFADICINELGGNSHWDTLIFQHTRCLLAPSRHKNDQWLAHTKCISHELFGSAQYRVNVLFSQWKVTLSKRSTPYYSNSTATKRLLLIIVGIEQNSGPKSRMKTGSTKPKAPLCIVCERPVPKNQKRLACEVCREFTHAHCSNSNIDLKFFSSSTPMTWTCPCCAFTALPFCHADFSDSAIPDSDMPGTDAIDALQFANEHLSALQERSNQLKVLHINTQSMVSTSDKLLVTMNAYPFDVVAMSETWLKDYPHLLSYVNIPGYCSIFKNHDRVRGGGVGAYVREGISFKRRFDIENIESDLERYGLRFRAATNRVKCCRV